MNVYCTSKNRCRYSRKRANFDRSLKHVRKFCKAFGELALHHAAPRNATCRTLEDCHFATLARDQYDKLLKAHYGDVEEEKVALLQKVPLFAALPEEAVRKLATNFVAKIYHHGDSAAQRGRAISEIVVVHSGELAVHVPPADADDLAPDARRRQAELARGPTVSSLLAAPMLLGVARFANVDAVHTHDAFCVSMETRAYSAPS